jgi:hypothetical protein
LGQVIELCRTCGFDIPADADRCPACRPATGPALAARLVAGYALPTRSVHAVPHLRPRRTAAEHPLGQARAARSAFSFTTTLVLVTLTAAGLAWVAGQPRFVLQLPEGTVDRLDTVTTFSALASVAALVVGLLAMAGWCVRAAARTLRGRLARRYG